MDADANADADRLAPFEPKNDNPFAWAVPS
jgi:hypothetical protein